MDPTLVPAGVMTYSVPTEADSTVVLFQTKDVQEPTFVRNSARAAFRLVKSLQIVSPLCYKCERVAHGAQTKPEEVEEVLRVM